MRLILLLTFVGLLFLGGLFWLQYFQKRQMILLGRSKLEEQQRIFNLLVKVKSHGLESFVTDNTYWDELVSFTKTANPHWAKQNIDGSIIPLKIHAAWIFRPDGSMIYSTNTVNNPSLNNLAIPGSHIQAAIRSLWVLHFFIPTPAGVMEVFGAPIQSTADLTRKSPAFGYLLAGKLWNASFLEDLSHLAGAHVDVSSSAFLPADSGRAKGNDLSFSRALPGWDRKTISWIHVTSSIPFLAEYEYYALQNSILLFVFAGVIIGVLSFTLIHWVGRPLNLLSRGMDEERADLIKSLALFPDEFGMLAQLIQRFISQKNALLIQMAEREKAENALREARDHLEELVDLRMSQMVEINAELIRAKKEAEQASLAKSQFMANISHELRTPMNGILGGAQFLRESNLPQELQEFITIMIQSSHRLMSLIDDLLKFSHLEDHPQIRPANPFDVYSLFQAALTPAQEAALNKGLNFSWNLSPTLPGILCGDSESLMEILKKVCDNSVKFTVKGEIQVSAQLQDPHPAEQTGRQIQMEIRIRDTGIGIPPHQEKVIFEAFRQVDGSSTRRYGGSGIGLSIAKLLVDRMGGQINYESTVGSGTTFFIQLPYLLPEKETLV